MAKKRTVQKKVSRSGKDRHNSEILRAKRAVSAALSEEFSVGPGPVAAPAVTADSSRPAINSSSPAGIPTAMRGLVRMAAGLIGRRSEPPADADRKPLAANSSLLTSADPVADLARRHIQQSAKSLSRPQYPNEKLCRQILANLAQLRLDTVPHSNSKHTRI